MPYVLVNHSPGTGKSEKQPCNDKPDVKIVAPVSSGEGNKAMDKPDIAIDTIYEPGPVKPAKAPKQSVSKAVQPVVAATLSGIVKQPTVSHHPQCSCGVCKPA
jgi:hypothetical protein